MRELRDSVAGQYGSQAVPNARVHPGTRVSRELRDSVANQYGYTR